MNVLGIVAEYNPFHNGHAYQLKKSKEITGSDAVIAVMSGNYVQRGAPAIIDKWTRTKIALLNGIDLVIELPCVYSISSAEFFSFGAISLLNSTGVVKNICFGSETDNIEALKTAAHILSDETEEYKEILKHELKKGLSFPHARYETIKNIMHDKKIDENEAEQILKSSNNILGIEYIKSLIKLKSGIKPYCIKRIGSSYSSYDIQGMYPSALALRKSMYNTNDFSMLKDYFPYESMKIISKLYEKNYDFAHENKMLSYIKYKCYMDKDSLKKLPDVKEGIENRIYKYIPEAQSMNDLIQKVKTKRYTYARISRILCEWFAGFDMFDTQRMRKEECPYARVLGFNDRGRSILKLIKMNTSIPIYTKLPYIKNDTLNLDLKSSKAYTLLNKNSDCFDDYKIGPIIIN